jgi:beta-galactosidase
MGDPAEVGGTLAYTELKSDLIANATNPDFVVRLNPDHNPGKDVSYAQPGFNDTSWRLLNLPHDWGIEQPFDMALPGVTGKLPWSGVGWYRKSFDVPASDAGKRMFLDMDGAMAYASIWLNGQYLGGWPYGYNSFQVELTKYLKPGANNVLAIRLDNPPTSSRWYPGGGIYRNVWLETMNPVHVEHYGVYVTTDVPVLVPDGSAVQPTSFDYVNNTVVTAPSATVNIKVTVANQSDAAANVTVGTKVYSVDADGNLGPAPVAINRVLITTPHAATDATVNANGNQTVSLSCDVTNPKLWSLQNPHLYAVVTTVEQNGQIVDTTRTNFGIRTIKFDPAKGFFLNGQHVRINGVCDHSDLGPLGTVINVRGLERQIEMLKEMGCNAIRTSHNMPSPELLDLCDRMGVLIMDESFDCWARQKVANDYNKLWPDWHEKDIRAEVRRDRNHPAIILWSVGNEIPEQGSAVGNQILADLTKFVHEEDPTRMTVTANNGNGFRGFSPTDYVYGFNYEPARAARGISYEGYHQQFPDWDIVGSETSSCISARGVYVFPVTDDKSKGATPNHLMSSYDLYAPSWANAPDVEFAAQDKNPFVAGEFVWTGFDYLGEPTNNGRDGTDASRSSYFGIIDLDGFKKDRFYIYQAHWRPDLPMAHILPHWNWAGREGQVTPVHVYTSGDEAELFVNGVSQGRKKKGEFEYRIRWDDVVYQPGELHVVAYKDGKVWAEDTVKTTGAPARVAMAADRSVIADDGADISYITVSIKDKDGLTVPDAMNKLHYEITGPGEIVAVDNGDETSLLPIQNSKDSKAFNGLALVIVRGTGQPGTITLTATSDDLTTATTTIATKN